MNMYVDDLSKSVDSLQEAKRIIEQITQLFSKYGFKLTKWLSNERKILEYFTKDELSPNLRELNCFDNVLPHRELWGYYGIWTVIYFTCE